MSDIVLKWFTFQGEMSLRTTPVDFDNPFLRFLAC